MRKLFLLLFFPVILFSQKQKNISLVPMGTFKMKREKGNDTSSVTVSVMSFYMTNEITNKEYRKFVEYLKNNPADCLTILNIKKFSAYKLSKNKNKKDYFISVKNSELLKDIIDTTVWNDHKDGTTIYKNYFSDSKFDNYPVVGVSYENAAWYCVWRSKTENDERAKAGKPLENDWRVPTEAEWLYAASGDKQKFNTPPKLFHVNSRKANSFGVKNLECNVAEWTSTLESIDLDDNEENGTAGKKIVRGGSFQSECSTDKKLVADKNYRGNFIGFRMVRTYYSHDQKSDL
jgi:formylglycine-generating enzyme